MKKEYIELSKNRYLLKNSNGIIVSKKDIANGNNKSRIEPETEQTNKSDKK